MGGPWLVRPIDDYAPFGVAPDIAPAQGRDAYGALSC
jgi:hypothetical protein